MTAEERKEFDELSHRVQASEDVIKEMRETQYDLVEAVNKMMLLAAVQVDSAGGLSWTKH